MHCPSVVLFRLMRCLHESGPQAFKECFGCFVGVLCEEFDFCWGVAALLESIIARLIQVLYSVEHVLSFFLI
jgi:hypothetical protein